MRFSTLSILAAISGFACAGPFAINSSPTMEPFWTERGTSMVLEGPLFHAFDGPNPADPSLVQLFEIVRWAEKGNYNHLYTTSEEERVALMQPGRGVIICGSRKNPCNTWIGGTEDIYVWNTPAPGRVPLYRLYDVAGQYNFYTLGEGDAAATGFQLEGIAAYVLPGPVEGSTQFYRWRRA